MLHRLALALIVTVSALLLTRPAHACLDCSAPTCQSEQADRCPASQTLWTDFLSCVRRDEGDPAGGCANECASWLGALDACAMGPDPLCTPVLDGTDACYACWSGHPAAPYEGIGCATEDAACSLDRTGCITCADYLGGGNIDGVCQDGVADQAAADLSVCACEGPCATECKGSCPLFLGWAYLERALPLSQRCDACLKEMSKGGCGFARAACAGH